MVRYATSVGAIQDAASVNRVIVVGTEKAYDASFSPVVHERLLSELVPASDAPPSSFFDSLWKTLGASQSTEHWIQRSGSASLLRFALAKLPSAVSRHNAPGQPHNVTALLKGLGCGKHDDSTLVVLLVEDAAHVASTAYAVARVATRFDGLPSHDGDHGRAPDSRDYYYYSRKTTSSSSSSSGGDGGDVATKPLLQVAFSVELSDAQVLELTTVCRNILLARRLVDAPCNELHTSAFVKEAMIAVETLPNVTVDVIEGQALEQGGYGGIYGVGKAAEYPPALVVLKHHPSNDSKSLPAIVLVGKGIVYDTGGLSIKTKTGMPGMKRDMGGAAAILGAFCSIVKQYSTDNNNNSSSNRRPVHAVLCLAENSVSSIATRPDDVHIMRSGKSVEINNTDAEGRLVLADGVAHAVEFLNPGTIVDMATLTGAQGIATGRFFAAIYCNDEDLETTAVNVGRSCGDLVHAVPYAPEFFIPEFKSAVADMKNSVADRVNAQVSCAGQFIGNHMQGYLEQNGSQWLHVDMAYPVLDKKDERATGYGVALLHSLVQRLQQQ